MFDAYILIALGLSIIAPLALIITRHELQRVRSRIVTELVETIFKGQGDLPQIGLVVARYNGSKINSRQNAVMACTGSAFFAVVCFIGFSLLIVPVVWLFDIQPSFPKLTYALIWGFIVNADAVTHANTITSISGTMNAVLSAAAVGAAAFVGGYIFQLQYLIRATLNQELSALAFVRSSLQVVQGMLMALILYGAMGVTMSGGETASLVKVPFGIALGTAFVVGCWPDLGINKLASWLNIKIKRVDPTDLAMARLIPLEVIDGIDSSTSFRLQESNLYDVQNLATINPIELYAETPFTLFETFDWVLQAQLCLVVGTPTFRTLKEHNIRTIFDLERAVLAEGAPTEYIQAIGSVLFDKANNAFRAKVGLPPVKSNAAITISSDVVRHAVAIIGDDLHVHRLRALWSTMLQTTSGQDSSGPLWLYPTGPLPGEASFYMPVLNTMGEAAVGLADALGKNYQTAVIEGATPDALAKIRQSCLVAAQQAISHDPNAIERLRLLWNPHYLRKSRTESSLESFHLDADFKALLD